MNAMKNVAGSGVTKNFPNFADKEALNSMLCTLNEFPAARSDEERTTPMSMRLLNEYCFHYLLHGEGDDNCKQDGKSNEINPSFSAKLKMNATGGVAIPLTEHGRESDSNGLMRAPEDVNAFNNKMYQTKRWKFEENTEQGHGDVYRHQWMEAGTQYDMTSPVGSIDDKQLTPSSMILANSSKEVNEEGRATSGASEHLNPIGAATEHEHSNEAMFLNALQSLSLGSVFSANSTSFTSTRKPKVNIPRYLNNQSAANYQKMGYADLECQPNELVLSSSDRRASYQLDIEAMNDITGLIPPVHEVPLPEIPLWSTARRAPNTKFDRKLNLNRWRPTNANEIRMPSTAETDLNRCFIAPKEAMPRATEKADKINAQKSKRMNSIGTASKPSAVRVPQFKPVADGQPPCPKTTSVIPKRMWKCPPLSTGGAATPSLPQPIYMEWLFSHCKHMYDELTAKLAELGISEAAARVSDAYIMTAGAKGEILNGKRCKSADKMRDMGVEGVMNEGDGVKGVPAPSRMSSLPYGVTNMLAHPDEFKNPSSFLKIYGDPLCGSQSQPQRGIDGNWTCKRCRNLNYPRRFKCNKCRKTRDEEGDRIVAEYTNIVYQHHSQKYKTIGKPGDSALEDTMN